MSKRGEKLVENSVVPYVVLFVFLISILPAPVLAAVNVDSTINEDIFVTIDFNGIDPSTYANVKANTRFNATTIPPIIIENLAQRNLRRVRWGYARIDYDDIESSVHVAFRLSGSDIVSFTVDKTTMVRTYQVSTDWRKFRVDLADGFSVDFAQYFSTPLSLWQKTNRVDALGIHHSAYHHEHLGEGFFNMSFYFILPSTATKVQASEDTITFEVPPNSEDVFLNSPLLVLGPVMAISVIVVAYRKTKA